MRIVPLYVLFEQNALQQCQVCCIDSAVRVDIADHRSRLLLTMQPLFSSLESY